MDLAVPGTDLQPLFELIFKTIPAAPGTADGDLQILVTNLDYSDYLGRLAIARVFNGTLKNGETVNLSKIDGKLEPVKITKLFTFNGSEARGHQRDHGRRHRRHRRHPRHHHRRKLLRPREPQAAARHHHR